MTLATLSFILIQNLVFGFGLAAGVFLAYRLVFWVRNTPLGKPPKKRYVR